MRAMRGHLGADFQLMVDAASIGGQAGVVAAEQPPQRNSKPARFQVPKREAFDINSAPKEASAIRARAQVSAFHASIELSAWLFIA